MINHNKYTFSFTGASALISETLVIVEEYQILKDWKAAEKSLFDKNLMHKVKQTTFKREFFEIKKRLSHLTPDQMNVMIYGGFDDAKAIILLSLVKTYAYLNDFIIEVIRNKFLVCDYELAESDYTRFYESKYLHHPELVEITEITANKVKQVVLKLLEQVGLITHIKNGSIIKPLLSSKVLDVILEDDPAFLTYYLYSNHEIKLLLQKLQLK